MSCSPDLTTPQLHVAHAVDVDQLAQSITGWEQVYNQTSPGRFRGELTELLLGPAQIFAESSSHALVQTCKTRPEAVWFGIPGQASRLGRIEGAPIEHGMLAVRPGHSDFQLTTPDNFVFFGVVVETEALRLQMEQDGGMEMPENALEQRVLRVSDADLHIFRLQLCRVLRTLPAVDSLSLGASADILDQIMSGLSQLLASRQASPRDSVSSQHARRLIRRVREYVYAHDDRSITVHELCTQLGASRRALQDCFRKSMDLTPKAYLHAYGLNAARRELRRTDSSCSTVSDVAARYGFWHLSQFAADYKLLFGELPSESLRQRRN